MQITAAETVGVEQRGEFYEATGALRDMVPNHLFTLLSMVAMEPPTGFGAAAILSKKAELLTAIPASSRNAWCAANIGVGTVLGKPVRAYRQEVNVAPDSNVETYVAMQLEIDNWRWPAFHFTPYRQAHVATEYGNRDPFQAGALRRVPGHARRQLAPQLVGVAHRRRTRGSPCNSKSKRPGPVVDLAA